MYHPDVFHIPRDEPEGVASPTTTVILTLITAVLVPGVIAYYISTDRETRTVAVVLAVLGGLVLFARPFWGLVLLTGLIYVRPEDTIPELAGMRLTLAVSVATIVATYVHLVLTKQPLARSPAHVLLIGFWLSAAASTFSFGNEERALEDVGKLVILVLLITNLARSPERLGTLITMVLVFTAYVAGYAIYLYYTGGALDHSGLMRARGKGIFADPNDLAATIVSGMALALFRSNASKGTVRLWYLMLVGGFLAGVLFTGSRGGMVGMIAVVGSFVLSSVRFKGLAVGLAVTSALAFLTFGPQRMTTFDATDESAYNRFMYWDNGWRLLIENPVLGVGYGRFPDLNGGATAHNSMVLCAAELGALGYFCWLGLLYFSFRPGDLSRGSHGGPTTRPTDLAACKLALMGYLVSVFWISRTYVMVFYVLIGMCLAGQLSEIATRWKGEQPRYDTLANAGRIAILCALTLGTIRAITLYYL